MLYAKLIAVNFFFPSVQSSYDLTFVFYQLNRKTLILESWRNRLVQYTQSNRPYKVTNVFFILLRTNWIGVFSVVLFFVKKFQMTRTWSTRMREKEATRVRWAQLIRTCTRMRTTSIFCRTGDRSSPSCPRYIRVPMTSWTTTIIISTITRTTSNRETSFFERLRLIAIRILTFNYKIPHFGLVCNRLVRLCKWSSNE